MCDFSRASQVTEQTDALRQLYGELQEDLRGYPVGSLLDEFRAAPEQAQRQRQVVAFILQQWAEILWREMVQLPPTEHPLVRELRQRMARTRAALLRLCDALSECEHPEQFADPAGRQAGVIKPAS